MATHAIHDALWPGLPYPRGATWNRLGVNFAPYSEHAERVELCLFDDSGRHEVQRLTLREQTDQVWHDFLSQARPGLLCGVSTARIARATVTVSTARNGCWMDSSEVAMAAGTPFDPSQPKQLPGRSLGLIRFAARTST
ncbi:MAG: hypothetical protein M3Y32_07335 [Pseudomonadota bacterium]|nr:hypothetical protein [Pseudomonadota bacterium]